MRNPNACITDPNKFVTNPGDRYHILYSPIVNSDGTITLMETGKDDIQQMIDSYREQTDMSYILAAMAAGDTSVISKKTPMYGDFTQMPETYAEALQLVIDAENEFNKLPLDVRNKFDNDYKQWFAQAGNEEWFDKMGIKNETEQFKEEIKNEVISDES